MKKTPISSSLTPDQSNRNRQVAPLELESRSRYHRNRSSRRIATQSHLFKRAKVTALTGSQFTSEAFTDILKGYQIEISMDGKGSWRDNVFIERLWRSVKYEEVYLRAYDSVTSARASLGRYLAFYNPVS